MTVTQSDALTDDDMLVTCQGDNGEMPLDYMEKLSITVLIDGLLFHRLQRQGTLLDSRGAVVSSEFRTDYSGVLLNSVGQYRGLDGSCAPDLFSFCSMR